jgi:hypothetical protein
LLGGLSAGERRRPASAESDRLTRSYPLALPPPRNARYLRLSCAVFATMQVGGGSCGLAIWPLPSPPRLKTCPQPSFTQTPDRRRTCGAVLCLPVRPAPRHGSIPWAGRAGPAVGSFVAQRGSGRQSGVRPRQRIRSRSRRRRTSSQSRDGQSRRIWSSRTRSGAAPPAARLIASRSLEIPPREPGESGRADEQEVHGRPDADRPAVNVAASERPELEEEARRSGCVPRDQTEAVLV